MNPILSACIVLELGGIWLCCYKIIDQLRQKHHGKDCDVCGE